MLLLAMLLVKVQGSLFALGKSYLCISCSDLDFYQILLISHHCSCFKSNPHLNVPALSEKNSSNRLITVEEWLQVEPEFYEPLKQTAELQGDVNIASIAMHSICALRLSSVKRTWENKKWPESAISTSIKSFPIGLSTRNLCLIGKFH